MHLDKALLQHDGRQKMSGMEAGDDSIRVKKKVCGAAHSPERDKVKGNTTCPISLKVAILPGFMNT